MRNHFLRTARPITYISGVVALATVATTSHPTSILPSGWAVGDLLIAMGVDNGTFVASWTSPSGWSEVLDGSGRFVSWKIAASGETAPTFTSSSSNRSTIYVLCFRFATYDVVGSLGATASPSVAPAITLSGGGGTTIAFFSNRNTVSGTFTTPTDYTSVGSDSDANPPSSAVFRRDSMASGTTGDVTSTPSGTNAVGLLIGIKPLK